MWPHCCRAQALGIWCVAGAGHTHLLHIPALRCTQACTHRISSQCRMVFRSCLCCVYARLSVCVFVHTSQCYNFTSVCMLGTRPQTPLPQAPARTSPSFPYVLMCSCIHMLVSHVQIDLRSADELAEDPAGSHLFARATLQRYTRQWASGQVRAFVGLCSARGGAEGGRVVKNVCLGCLWPLLSDDALVSCLCSFAAWDLFLAPACGSYEEPA